MLIVAALSVFADLASKNLVFHYLLDRPVAVVREQVLERAAENPRLISTLIPDHKPVRVVPELLDFTLVLNPGAVFGIGPGKRWFFIAFTVVALAFGLMMFARWTTTRDRWAHAAIGLLIGGGLGNLYDRLTYACVRDFIHPLPGWNWPFSLNLLVIDVRRGSPVWPYVSNVADLLLLIGIGMLLVHLWRRDKSSSQAAGTDAGGGGGGARPGDRLGAECWR